MPEKHAPGNEGTDRDDRALIDAARGQVEDALEREKQRDRTPPTHTAQQAEPGFDGPPTDSFTGYKIIDEIHRGGQGVVYKALQESTKRKVAIKVMKEGPFAGSSEKARFEREVQILGQLKHPNIVAIHDTGVAAGCDYFVMDYISGRTLDAYLAAEERSIEETLELFGKICEAVNAAHLHGVIHRDLKPGNIRVDPSGQPHILDFGLAKVAASGVSVMTMTGQFVGSLPWASPEQAEGVPSKVDVRTDVYSLGVILYQMLTGKFPYDVIGNMRDVLDRIMKAEPARPSTIRKQINDEVETIVLKCLSKERERRYATAGVLADDIKHYLAGEPIEAKRDSFGYVLRKQLNRYKIPAAIAASFVIVITVGFLTTLTFWRQAAAERDRALLAEGRAQAERELALTAKNAEEQARKAAEEQADEARRQRDIAEWQSYLANVAAGDAALQVNDTGTVRRRLDAAPEKFRNWEWHYLNTASDRSLGVLRGHEGWVLSAAFSPDGARVVTASRDGTARIWDTATGKDVAILRGHDHGVLSAAFSPDGSRVVTRSSDYTARVWDAATGKEVVILRGHNKTVNSAAFSPDGSRVVTASQDSTARVWDAATGEEVAILRGHEDRVWSTTFSPDGSRVVTASDDRTARLWDAATGKEVAILRGHEGWVSSAAFSPDGSRVVTASVDHTARVWDAATGAEVTILRGNNSQPLAALSPDGSRVVTAAGRTARVWDSVPYRVRYQERQAILAEPIVDNLWQQLNDWKSIAKQLRENASLSEPLRRAALNLVQRRASNERSQDMATPQP